MPTLINKINRAHWNSLLKADYSILAQAHQYLTNEDDGLVGKLSNCGGNTRHICFRDVMTSRIKKAFVCDSNGNESGKCFPSPDEIELLNGAAHHSGSYVAASAQTTSIVLENGSALAFYLDSPTCEKVQHDLNNVCGWVLVDVNGGKKPNIVGEDIYLFYIFKTAVRPYTLSAAIYKNNQMCDKKNASYGAGYDCALYYLGR